MKKIGIHMKRMSTKMAILIPSLIALIAGVVIMVVIVSTLSATTANNLTNELVGSTVARYANEFRTISGDTYAVMSAVAPVVQRLAQTAKEPRSEIQQVLEGVLSGSDSMYGIWTCWEPDVLDGKDRFYANTRSHDATGRYIPYITRGEGGEFEYEALTGYDDPVAGAYYLEAKNQAKPYITDPFYYTTGSGEILVYTISIPILRDGEVVGVVGADINVQTLMETMNTGKILDDGYIYTLSPSGLIATHQNSDLLMRSYTTTWMAGVQEQVENVTHNGGEFTARTYSDVTNSTNQFLGVGVEIGDTGRYWMVCGVVPVHNITASSTLLMWVTIAVGLLLIAAVGFLVYINVRGRLKDLPLITDIAEAMAVGDIDSSNLDAQEGATKNEITLLSRAFGKMTQAIRQQAAEMSQIAQGDYSGQMPVRSEKDVMNQAINGLLDSTNQALEQINAVSGQVSVGSKQIADGAQALAAGSTEQAASIEELSSAISEVADQTRKNVEMSSQAAQLASNMREKAEEGSRQMGNMMEAVRDISSSSHDIGKVIKVIDDIAFQTNILALNAAVEAARAGAAGKGFAVVADEVRNLAAKSAEAAQNTSSLIESSISKAEVGVKIAGSTATALQEILAGVNDTTDIVQSIAAASESQSFAISQINQGIEQVANVVQQNSATAEESAASSEEMNGQAELLTGLVSQFKLRDAKQTQRDPSREQGFDVSDFGADRMALPTISSGFGDSKY